VTRAAALAVGLLLSAPSSRAAQWLPELSVHLEAARYAPSERDFQWTGWIGGGADLVRAAGATAYFSADAETVLGDERRPFEANQANYHLEVGVRRSVGSVELGGFYHHVSRHAIDRAKPEAVDWNMLGLRAELPFPTGVPFPGRACFSVARATLASRVGYRWELTAAVEGEWFARPWGRGYVRAGARLLTVDPAAEVTRDGFVDGLLEAGLRFRRAGDFDVFASFERRNDVFLLTPGARSRALFGVRFALADRRIFR
jgi:hypothetical protein